ncbi:MAG: ATP-binding cassette domain-containing protein, partial [Candidatus Latescibacterota bacterium]
NGAGKTTLMNLLAGDLEPTHGDQRKSHKLRIGRYNQHFVDALAFDVSPVEYLVGISGLKAEEIRAKLGKFGLSGHHHLQPICKLSGGQKARVVFAAIALSSPHILLLDEPTHGFDPLQVLAFRELLHTLKDNRVILFSSHIIQEVSALSDRVLIINNGHLLGDGRLQDLAKKTGQSETDLEGIFTHLVRQSEVALA